MHSIKPENISVAGFTFRKLGFDTFDRYAHYFRDASHEDMTFYGSFPLMMYRRYGFAIIDGYFALFHFLRTDTGVRIDSVGLPISEKGERLDIAMTKKCLAAFNGGTGGRIVHLHPALNARYRHALTAEPLKAGGSEYVYSNELLGGLQGGEWKNLRKRVNHFANRYRVEIVPYESKFRDEADLVYGKWRQSEGTKYDAIWDRTLFTNLLDHYGVMDHQLFMVREISAGACIGLFDAVRIGPKLAIGVMRKLDTSFANIAQYCQTFLARHLSAQGCTFLNDGDDANGRPGLKALKSGFHPISIYTPLLYKF